MEEGRDKEELKGIYLTLTSTKYLTSHSMINIISTVIQLSKVIFKYHFLFEVFLTRQSMSSSSIAPPHEHHQLILIIYISPIVITRIILYGYHNCICFEESRVVSCGL